MSDKNEETCEKKEHVDEKYPKKVSKTEIFGKDTEETVLK